jgi:hypothetical protein
MSTPISLKEIERKAFRSTYHDGLWDIYLGLVVVCMAIFVYRPVEGYGPTNIVLAIVGITLAYGLLQAGKRLITLPRLGQVRFGAIRKRKKTTQAILLGVIVLIQVGVVGLTALAWANPAVGAKLSGLFPARNLELLLVAAVAALFVGPSMLLRAYFTDFPRGYYIAVMMALATFLMIYLNQPLYPLVIGSLIILPGLVLLVRFLRKYPRLREEMSHE